MDKFEIGDTFDSELDEAIISMQTQQKFNRIRYLTETEESTQNFLAEVAMEGVDLQNN